jgi:hypothetical protein
MKIRRKRELHEQVSIHSKHECSWVSQVTRAKAVCEHKDEAPDQHDWNRIYVEPEAIADPVTHVRVAQGPDDHEYVWWCYKQKTDDMAVAERCGESREEILEAVARCQCHSV